MPTFDEARRLIMEHVAPTGKEKIPLSEAVGRALGEDVVAPWDLPRSDNSAMDGYAVRAEDCGESVTLGVAGYIPAGSPVAGAGGKGTAVRIMTGAPVPEGYDAVVPVEETEAVPGDAPVSPWEARHVRIPGPVKKGAHVRFRGEDVLAGERILSTGTTLRPPEISMLASLGMGSVPVFRKARVAILSTGDELVEIGEPLPPGMLVNSNSHSLAAAVREAGGVPVPLGIARDDRESLRGKIAEGFSADALVTSAGVSAGDRDLVREILADLSVKEIFWRVDIRPGRPTAFGVKGGKPVFALPGNPVSSMITFEEFVRPALRRMMGHAVTVKPYVKAILKEPLRKKEGRVQFLRVKVDVVEGEYVVRSSGDQATGILKTMLHADGIAVLPADRTRFDAGEKVNVHLLYQGSFIP